LVASSNGDEFKLHEELETLKTLSPRQHSALGEHLAIVEDDEFEETIPKASEFELLFKQTNGLVKRLLEQFEKPEGTPNAKSDTIRLPEISLPTFSGNQNEWVYYRERLTALISTNEGHTNEGRNRNPAMLQSSNDKFNSLWSALTKRYEIKHIIVKHCPKL
jgi:hypothetical protein